MLGNIGRAKELWERLTRLESSCNDMEEDLSEIKSTLKELKKTLLLIAMSGSVVGSFGSDYVEKIIANQVKDTSFDYTTASKIIK